MNKKGIAVKRMLVFLYQVLYAAFVLALTVVLIKIVLFTSTQTEQLESDVFMNRIYNSQSIMYTDTETSRIYAGIIDVDKFTEESLLTDVNYLSEKRLSAKLILYDANKLEVKNMYYNKNLYTYLDPLIKAKMEGSSSGTKFEKQFPITYKDQNEFRKGFLFITVLRQND
jgi:hypothetical protein